MTWSNPISHEEWLPGLEHQAVREAWSTSEVGWELYPIYAVARSSTLP
jgi:hypothetical protein